MSEHKPNPTWWTRLFAGEGEWLRAESPALLAGAVIWLGAELAKLVTPRGIVAFPRLQTAVIVLLLVAALYFGIVNVRSMFRLPLPKLGRIGNLLVVATIGALTLASLLFVLHRN